MTFETIAVLLVLLPLGYELYALLSQQIGVLPRAPSYSQLVWRSVDRWPLWRKWVIITLVSLIFVWTMGHFFFGWTRSLRF